MEVSARRLGKRSESVLGRMGKNVLEDRRRDELEQHQETTMRKANRKTFLTSRSHYLPLPDFQSSGEAGG